MAVVIKPITVEVSKPNVFQAIAAKQNDCNSRFLKVTFVNEGEKIFISPSATVTINATRNDGESESFFGTVNSDGTATVPIHSWILELVGYVDCDVSIIEADSKLTCTTFSLLIEKATHNSDDVSTDPQYDVLTELIKNVQVLDDEMIAYTEATYTKNQRTDSLEKRIINLEQGIVPSPFETDNTVAYRKDVPANALPFAEVSMIGGMTYKDGDTLKSAPVTEVESVGANLFNIPDIDFSKNVYVSTLQSKRINATFKENTQYRFSWKSTFISGTEGVALYVRIYYTDGTNNEYNGIVARSTDKDTKKVVITEQGKTVKVVTFLYSVNALYQFTETMLTEGTEEKPYTPYVRNTLPIPQEVQALDGYGEGNPDNAEEYNAIICENGKWKYIHKGDIEDNAWVSLATPIITDISALLPEDNFIGVEGGGTVTMVNEHQYSVPSSITYQVKGDA
jgi:hypothetical protein